jgi:two-component system NtrC family sensor kinase
MTGTRLAVRLAMAGAISIFLAGGPLSPGAASASASAKRRGSLWIVALMLLSIGAVALVATWDDRRESAAALDDFAGAQVALAHTVAALTISFDQDARERLASIEEPGSVLVLIASGGVLERPRGEHVHSEPIEGALSSHQAFARLSRPEAAALGLPSRTALAGIAYRDVGGTQVNVVVVATALRERDREIRAANRLVLALGASIAIVVAFGTLALRKQRAELKLARDLAVADALRTGDERLMRADRLATLGALATGIAHEVSTPLGVIVGRAEQLGRKVQGDERAENAAKAIAEQADRIGKIVRGFLGLCRGEAGQREEVTPRDVVDDALELVGHRFERAGVQLGTVVAEGLPAIFCEPKLFTQVLVNLLLNACDACQPGGLVTIGVSHHGERVAFTVLDDGHGITVEDSERAMEPFFTTKPPGKGTGLGLAIATEIVSHHGGTLTLGPRPDGKRGTLATVEISRAGKEQS